uniref:Uncharacterized protein n=1 Tax=Phyllostachys edulis TaxID=38705 RepID=D3IVM1_PHYED|nr:hypothetical protein [Phyllostachys edulis]
MNNSSYDSFALGDYGLSPEEIASMEAAAATSSQPEGQDGVPSSGSTATSGSTPTGAKRSRPPTSRVSTGGMRHLLRYATRCKVKQELVIRQIQLRYNPDVTIDNN